MIAATKGACEYTMSVTEKRDRGFRLPQVSRPITVKQQVYETLREQLLHGQPGPNGRVVEKDITDALGVSRTPVREALARLASEGLLVSTRHGYKVPEFSLSDVLHLFELRMLLEPAAARQAAENPTPDGITGMERAIDQEKAAHVRGAVTQFLRAHSTFRELWLRRTRNPLLLESLTRTVHSLQAIRRRTMSSNHLREFMIESQERLLTAIKRHDGNEAAAVQTNSVKTFERLIRLHIFPEQ
jgi:DNA-binding GntR family transcriptional regulator